MHQSQSRYETSPGGYELTHGRCETSRGRRLRLGEKWEGAKRQKPQKQEKSEWVKFGFFSPAILTNAAPTCTRTIRTPPRLFSTAAPDFLPQQPATQISHSGSSSSSSRSTSARRDFVGLCLKGRKEKKKKKNTHA